GVNCCRKPFKRTSLDWRCIGTKHFACSFKFLTIFQPSTPSSAAPEVKTKGNKSMLPVSFWVFSRNNLLTILSQTSHQSTDKWSQALAKAHAAQNALANVDCK